MATAAPSLPSTRALLGLALTLALVPLSFWIGHAPLHVPLLVTISVTLFGATVFHAEAGLVILILSMLLSPEIDLAGGGGGGLDRGRSVMLRTEDLVLILVGLAWIARMAIHKDLGAIRRTRLNAAIGAYTAACILSTLIGIEAGRVRALVGICFVAKYIEYFIIFLITVNYVRNRDQLRRLLIAVLVTAAIIVLYAYAQIPMGVRPSAPFEGKVGEPNTLGGYLVLIFSVACAIALTVPDRRWKRWCGTLAVASIPALLATLSRSSWLSLTVVVIVLLILSPARRRLAALGIIGLAILLLATPSSVEKRIAYTFTPEGDAVGIGKVQLDPSSSARLSSWKTAVDGFLERPILGWGVTGFGFLDAQYFRVLVEIGAFGFATFAFLLFSCGRAFLQAFTRLVDPLHRSLGLGMTAALAGLLVHAIGTNTFLIIRIMEPYWLLCGLVIAAHALENER